MSRPLRPITHAEQAQFRRALDHLRAARGFLTRLGAKRSAAAVRRAMKSTEGAIRHADRRPCADCALQQSRPRVGEEPRR